MFRRIVHTVPDAPLVTPGRLARRVAALALRRGVLVSLLPSVTMGTLVLPVVAHQEHTGRRHLPILAACWTRPQTADLLLWHTAGRQTPVTGVVLCRSRPGGFVVSFTARALSTFDRLPLVAIPPPIAVLRPLCSIRDVAHWPTLQPGTPQLIVQERVGLRERICAYERAPPTARMSRRQISEYQRVVHTGAAAGRRVGASAASVYPGDGRPQRHAVRDNAGTVIVGRRAAACVYVDRPPADPAVLAGTARIRIIGPPVLAHWDCLGRRSPAAVPQRTDG